MVITTRTTIRRTPPPAKPSDGASSSSSHSSPTLATISAPATSITTELEVTPVSDLQLPITSSSSSSDEESFDEGPVIEDGQRKNFSVLAKAHDDKKYATLVPKVFAALRDRERLPLDRILKEGNTFVTTPQLNLAISQYLIATGRLNYSVRSYNIKRIEVKCNQPDLKIVASRSELTFVWKILKIVDEQAGVIPYNGKALARKTAYSCHQLAPLLEVQLGVSNKLTMKQGRGILNQYLPKGLQTAAFITSVIRSAKQKYVRKPEDVAKYLPALKQVLLDQDYMVFTQIANLRDMQRVAYRNYKQDCESGRVEFLPYVSWLNTKKLRDATEGDVFPFSFTVIPPSAKNAFGTPNQSACLPLVVLDGTYVRSEMGGCLYLAYAYDANMMAFLLGAQYQAANENKRGWTSFFRALVDSIPGLDVGSTTVISDAFKGGKEAFNEAFNKAKLFMCYQHRSKNTKNACGGARRLYEKGVAALTPNELNSVLNEIHQTRAHYDAAEGSDGAVEEEEEEEFTPSTTRKGLKWLDTWPEESQFPLSRIKEGGNMYGVVAQSMVEGMNNAIMDARKQDTVVDLIIILLKLENDRYCRNKALADHCQHTCASKVRSLVAEAFEDTTKKEQHGDLSVVLTFNSTPRCTIADVREKRCDDGSVQFDTYRCNIVFQGRTRYSGLKFRCSCGVPRVHRLPCTHVVALYIYGVRHAANEQPSVDRFTRSLLPNEFLTTAWKECYSTAWDAPVRQNILAMKKNDRYQRVQIFKSKKGAKKLKKRHKRYFENGKRRKTNK
jgi:hypothetical protein